MVRAITIDEQRAQRMRDEGYWDGTTCFQHLETTASKSPNRTAIVDRAGSMTYGELLAEVERASSALAALGVGVGDVVSWQLPNWREGAILHFAAVRIGAISNPIVAIYREREISFILEKAASKVLVVPDEFRNYDYGQMARTVVDGAPNPCTVISVGATPSADLEWSDFLARGAERVDAAEQHGDRLSLLQFTSGTTADAKGVLHTNDTMSWEARSYSKVWGVREDDAVLAVSPIGHMAGLLGGVFVPALTGIPSVYLDRWDPEAAVRLIEEHRCTVAAGAAPFLSGIVTSPAREQHDISSFRFFSVGGSDVPPALIRAAGDIGIVAARTYGCTECPTISAGTAEDAFDTRALTDGVLQPGVRIKVVRADGSEAEPGEIGEFVVDAPMRTVGYLDPAHEEDSLGAGGWYRTGDLGVVEDGRLRVTGRSKDIIIRGGENISAKEVEDVLHEYAELSQVAVVGLPDEVLGERVVAFVTPRVGSTVEDVDARSVLERVASSGLAKQKVPERIIVVDELPQTASGKIQKFKLRARLRDGSA
ncbi:AMP-binding protein [Dactylosporangium sp. AC04546]|uniref:AMP-binding protein n=1 Tax=Dactylosporangium sp. AC04546 TaxID=2862460 RepID=UPI001EE148F5|nr:AMP-binding protein [Dactylosporangium sp. AC04546]WVK86830.1 AMP-binding protein [Dactylosporangium sp. AC04546]